MNYQKNGANKHSHAEPERHFMQARRSDVEHLIARCNSNPRMKGKAILVLEGSQLFMMCLLCEQPIAITDVELVPASFLYQDAEGCHFMDEKSFEQIVFANEDVGGDRGYLKDGLSLQVLK